MSDTIEEKVNRHEEICKELKVCLDEEHDRLDVQSEGLDRLLRWALDGNGETAEARLAGIEKKLEVLPAMQTTLQAVELVANAKLSDIGGVVKDAINAKDKTVLAYIKAFGPAVMALAALLAVILK